MTGRGVPNATVARHLEHLRLCGQTSGTIDARRRALVRMEALLPDGLLNASAADLLTWRTGLDLGISAVRGYVSHASQFYQWAITQELRTDNPAAALPVPRAARMLPRPIAEPDLVTALTAAPPPVRIWLVLAAWCGLRAKEIAYLLRANILETAMPPVLVVATAATKGHNERTVPLATFVLGEIAAAALPSHGYAFRRRDGRPGPNSPTRVSQLCNRHLHECGIAATLHQLRHRFGTQTYRASHDLRMVQELMGHADPATTAGYTAYDQAGARVAVEALAAPPRLRIAR
jgi:integrase